MVRGSSKALGISVRECNRASISYGKLLGESMIVEADASRRYGPEDIFLPPSNLDAKIWRYMDFSKYVSLLEKRALFLSRSDLLGDSFEGSLSPLNAVVQSMQASSHGRDPGAFTLPPEVRQSMRKMIYVNCWHANEHESVAMWSLYARSTEAVAVCSTYRKLLAQLPPYHYFGAVRYIDYRSVHIPEDNAFWPYAFKRLAFQHEMEMRIVTQAVSPPGPPGALMPVDLNSLIDGVYVAPNAARWFHELVESVTGKYGLALPVRQSSLDELGFL